MDSGNSHIVSRLRWDTSFDDKALGTGLQARLSDWSLLQLPKDIERVFDQICPPNQRLQIKSLELDLGEIYYDELEATLSKQITEKLYLKLMDMLLFPEKEQTNLHILSHELAEIEALSFFFKHGRMPWSQRSHHATVNQLTSSQLLSNEAAFIEMIKILGQQENSRKRIAWQLNEENLKKLTQGLEPYHYTQIIEFSVQVQHIQQQASLVTADSKSFNKYIWFWMLSHLLIRRGSIFSKIALARDSLQQMANHYNLSYLNLLRLIEQAIQQLSKSTSLDGELMHIIQILLDENPPSVNLSFSQVQVSDRLWDEFHDFMRVPASWNQKDKSTINELLGFLTQDDPQRFREMLKREAYASKLLDLYAERLDTQTLKAILEALRPDASENLSKQLTFLEKMWTQGKAIITRNELWKWAMIWANKQEVKHETSFLAFAIDELASTNKCDITLLLEKIGEQDLVFSNFAFVDLHQQYIEILAEKLNKNDARFISTHINPLLQRLIQGQSASSPTFNKLVSLLHKWIDVSPQQVFKAISSWSDQKQLSALLRIILDRYHIALLLKSISPTILKVLQQLYQEMKHTPSQAKQLHQLSHVEAKLFDKAFELIIAQPHHSPDKIRELLKKEFLIFFASTSSQEERLRSLKKSEKERAEQHTSSKAIQKATPTQVSLLQLLKSLIQLDSSGPKPSQHSKEIVQQLYARVQSNPKEVARTFIDYQDKKALGHIIPKFLDKAALQSIIHSISPSLARVLIKLINQLNALSDQPTYRHLSQQLEEFVLAKGFEIFLHQHQQSLVSFMVSLQKATSQYLMHEPAFAALIFNEESNLFQLDIQTSPPADGSMKKGTEESVDEKITSTSIYSDQGIKALREVLDAENTDEGIPHISSLIQQLQNDPQIAINAIANRSFARHELQAISKQLSFAEFTEILLELHEDRSKLILDFKQLQAIFVKVDWPAIPRHEVAFVFFQIAWRAWVHENWQVLTADKFWQEVIWELCAKRALERKDFTTQIAKIQALLPPPYLVSFSHLQANHQPQHKKVIMATQTPFSNPPSTQGISVPIAGLVIINTYYPMLFERLGAVKNDAFANEQAQFNAVHYLQYAATGQTETEESYLALNKILCGLSLETAVPSHATIAQNQQQFIDGMIEAAIQHWPAIGDSSVDGFRGNWLVREGLLVEQEDHWELTVEKKPYDILLNQSPFSFSIIKYHWMSKPLHVNWPY